MHLYSLYSITLVDALEQSGENIKCKILTQYSPSTHLGELGSKSSKVIVKWYFYVPISTVKFLRYYWHFLDNTFIKIPCIIDRVANEYDSMVN